MQYASSISYILVFRLGGPSVGMRRASANHTPKPIQVTDQQSLLVAGHPELPRPFVEEYFSHHIGPSSWCNVSMMRAKGLEKLPVPTSCKMSLAASKLRFCFSTLALGLWGCCHLSYHPYERQWDHTLDGDTPQQRDYIMASVLEFSHRIHVFTNIFCVLSSGLRLRDRTESALNPFRHKASIVEGLGLEKDDYGYDLKLCSLTPAQRCNRQNTDHSDTLRAIQSICRTSRMELGVLQRVHYDPYHNPHVRSMGLPAILTAAHTYAL